MFRHLYGRALCEVSVPYTTRTIYLIDCLQHVEDIDLVSGEMKLEGFISLSGALSKVKLPGFRYPRANRSRFTGIPVLMYEISFQTVHYLMSLASRC